MNDPKVGLWQPVIGIESHRSVKGRNWGWNGRYDDGTVAFGAHGYSGGIKEARIWARDLKKILKTNPQIARMEITGNKITYYFKGNKE